MIFLKLVKNLMHVKNDAYLRAFYSSGWTPVHVSINTCLFLCGYGSNRISYHWFLSHDKKRIRFLSAFLVGATWPMSFPVALLFSLF